MASRRKKALKQQIVDELYDAAALIALDVVGFALRELKRRRARGLRPMPTARFVGQRVERDPELERIAALKRKVEAN